MKFKALLRHLKDNLLEINEEMFSLFNDLLMREDWSLVGAYELYLADDDREDFLDTLFAIYKIKSGKVLLVVRCDTGSVRGQVEGAAIDGEHNLQLPQHVQAEHLRQADRNHP